MSGGSINIKGFDDYENTDGITVSEQADIPTNGINASDLNVNVVELDTVSGNTNLSFATQPRDIEIESVSGDINIGLPSDISGYSISRDSVSGNIYTNDFGGSLYYGDGYTQIDVDSVSGNLNINKN